MTSKPRAELNEVRELMLQLDIVQDLIKANAGVRKWRGGAVMTTNPRDIQPTKRQLANLVETLTKLINQKLNNQETNP